MQESATSRTGAGISGAGLLADHGDDASRLRRTVIAGPGGPVEVADTVLGGVLASLADGAVITAGLIAAGHTDRRRRVLTGLVTVAAVLGLCLFRRESYGLVLARVLPGSPRQVLDGGPPTGQALSTARTRLAPHTMAKVFEQAAAVMPPAGPQSYAFGLLLTASAPRGALSYPRQSREELRGRFLGLMANLDAKARGDNSMPEK